MCRHGKKTERQPLTEGGEDGEAEWGAGMTDFVASFTIPGQLPSMKNRRRIVGTRRNRPMLIKSQDAMDYEQAFLAAVPKKARIAYAGPVSVKARIWYQSRRSDLSAEFLFDLLQKSGVILNDRQVQHLEAFKGLDPERPRVHLSVYPWEEEAADV